MCEISGSTSAFSKFMKSSRSTAALLESSRASSHLTRQSMATVADNDIDHDVYGKGVSDWNWRDGDKFTVL